jgi:hypothetical protein
MDILPIAAVLFTVIVFFTYLFIRTPSSFRVKFIGIPLLVLSSFVGLYSVEGLLGKSVWGPPDGKFYLIDFYSTIVDTEDNSIIEMWLYLQDGTTKLFKLPYSDELLEKLKDVKKKQEGGQMMMGEWLENPQYGSGGNEDGGLYFKPMTPSHIDPK